MKLLLFIILVGLSLSIPLTNNGCTINNPCEKCQGNCNSDSHCAGGLKCFKRTASTQLVPGCELGGDPGTNYCYEPCPAGTNPTVGCTGQLSSVLASGSEPCGISKGSLDIWVNTAIATNEVYDMQSGDFRSDGTITGTGAQINGLMRASAGVIDGALSIGSLGGKVVDDGNIKDNAIKNYHIAANAVGYSEINYKAIQAANIADNTITASQIAANAVGASEIAHAAVGASEIAKNAVGSDEIQNHAVWPHHLVRGQTFDFHAVSAYDGYIRAGTPSWNSGWKVNLDQNVWIHHLLEVDGAAYFDSIAHFRGHGPSSMARQVIWGYLSYDGGPWGGGHDWAYVYGNTQTSRRTDVSADFDGYVIAKMGVMTRSDRRIKQNIVDVSDISSLNRVLKIPVRNYEYKNKLKRGYGNITGFIAQEVKEVFPEAVTLQTMGIPYIGATFKIFEMNNKIITVATLKEANATLMVGDKLNAYIHHPDDDENSHTRYRELEVLTVGESKTTLKCDECEENESANAIYIYEKIVDDFHVIDKDRIFTLHHGAIQELHKEQAGLKQKVLNLENTIAQLTQRLAALEAK